MIFRRTELASVSIAQYQSKRRFLSTIQKGDTRERSSTCRYFEIGYFLGVEFDEGIDGPRRISNLHTFSKCLWPKKPNRKVRPAAAVIASRNEATATNASLC